MDEVDRDGNPVPFSIKYVTYNRKNKTGGEVVSIAQAMKCVTKRGGKIIYDTREKSGSKRNPNHFKNSTRNLNIVGTDQIRKSNIRMIIEFNGQKVLW